MKVNIVNKDPKNKLPEYATVGSAGMDLRASIEAPLTIRPGSSKLIPTGLSIELPVGYEAQIRPRSGLAYKHQVTVLNSPGTIDSDYRGDIGVILINHSPVPFKVKSGDRIAQMVIAKYEQVDWNLVQNLSDTTRGDGGYGSTGNA